MEDLIESATDRKSGGTRDKGRDKFRSSGRQVLGKTKELGDHVYKIGTNDQADLFIRTTEAIAEYVGVEYGWELRILVKQRKEANFTKPKYPTQVATRSATATATAAAADPNLESAQIAEYKAELSIYHGRLDKYNEGKAKVFVIILGQCTLGVKSWLEQGRGLDKLEADRDVVGLLKLLEEMAFSNGGDQDEFLTLVHSWRKLATMQQGSKEPTAKYYKRLRVAADVLIGQWGEFVPSKLVKGGLTKEEVQDRFLARIFLIGADPKRFGSLIEELNNTYISGTDRYPKTLEDTQKLLSKYREPRSSLKKDDNDDRRGNNFNQKGKQASPRKGSPSRSSSPESTDGESKNKKVEKRREGRTRNRSVSPSQIGWSS